MLYDNLVYMNVLDKKYYKVLYVDDCDKEMGIYCVHWSNFNLLAEIYPPPSFKIIQIKITFIDTSWSNNQILLNKLREEREELDFKIAELERLV